jgi:hypothetical protein
LVVAKALYISKRARPDIESTLAFLCTRVSSPDEDDWKKLKRILSYLKGTIDDVRVIEATGLNCLTTWVDAAYALHNNMRSHTGGAMLMGRGLVYGRSSKQKLNTKSSTEAKLVGVSEYFPYNIWLVNFLKKQGYIIHQNELMQDNHNVIRLDHGKTKKIELIDPEKYKAIAQQMKDRVGNEELDRHR